MDPAGVPDGVDREDPDADLETHFDVALIDPDGATEESKDNSRRGLRCKDGFNTIQCICCAEKREEGEVRLSQRQIFV